MNITAFYRAIAIPPLLHKEMVEIAAARRTYVLRAVVALGFLGLFLLVAAPQLGRLAAGDVSVLGSGGYLFRLVAGWSFVAIYLFLPLLIVPVVTTDEERGNFEIFRTAGLEAQDYMLQKLVSRLLAVGGLLLLALPLAGLAYSLGGIGAGELIATAICLGLTLLQVGSVSLWVATCVRTSGQAAWQSHLRVALHLFLIMPLFYLPLLLAGWILLGIFAGSEVSMCWSIQPVGLWTALMSPAASWYLALLGGIPVLVASFRYFLQAIEGLRKREMERRREPLPGFLSSRPVRYHTGDGLVMRWVKKLVTSPFEGVLPSTHPLEWREVTRVPILRSEYLSVALLVLLLPLLPILFSSVLSAHKWEDQAYRLLIWQFILLTIGLLGVIPLAAGAIVGERRRSSLEVLLVSPLSSREILLGKLAGCHRLMRLVWIPCVLLAMLSVILGMAQGQYYYPDRLFLALPMQMGISWLMLSSAAWLGMAAGLVLRQATQAVAAALGLGLGWCLLPYPLSELTDSALFSRYICLLNPYELFALTCRFHTGQGYEPGRLDPFTDAIPLMLAVLFCLWLGLRSFCLMFADRWLGRA